MTLPKELRSIVNEATIKGALDNMEELIPAVKLVAVAQRLKFVELEKAGFSKAEALELCKGDLIPNIFPKSDKKR